MHRRIRLLSVGAALSALLASSLMSANPENPGDAMLKKMREALRDSMQKLQIAQGEKDALQTQLSDAEQKNKDLTEQLEALKKKAESVEKQAAAEKSASEKRDADLNASIANREQQIAQLTDSLGKWKEHDQKAIALLKKVDAERADSRFKAVAMERKAQERERQNLELYRIGMEILERYDDFSLGRAFLAREPFVGTTRVKLQAEVQDYRDKLADSKVKPDEKPKSTKPVEKKPASPTNGKKQY